MRALTTAIVTSLLLTGAALADNTDHLQTVVDEAVERTEKPIATTTSDGRTITLPVSTESGWADDSVGHPAYRPPFKADGSSGNE